MGLAVFEKPGVAGVEIPYWVSYNYRNPKHLHNEITSENFFASHSIILFTDNEGL